METPRLTTAEAAAFLGVHRDVLRHWRKKPAPGSPFVPYYRIGNKYAYLKADLEEYLQKVRVEEAPC